jgi:hypothetical protein
MWLRNFFEKGLAGSRERGCRFLEDYPLGEEERETKIER